MLSSKHRVSGRWPNGHRISSEDTPSLESNGVQRTITHRVDVNAATATAKFGLPKIKVDGRSLDSGEKTILDVREWV